MLSPSLGRVSLLALGILVLLAPSLPAQRIVPPAPGVYDVQIRYRIRAGRNDRIQQFLAMNRYLESVGFRPGADNDPNEAADPEAERLAGTLPSNRIREVLQWPAVRALLLMPPGYKLPADPEQRVLVQIELASGLSPTRQRDLRVQALEKLTRIGLVEKVGYDTQGNVRILGTVPAGDVDTLLKDLRTQPAGWFAPETPPVQLPDPIGSVSPLRIVEILPEPEGEASNADVSAPTPPPAGREFLAKIAPELREAAAGEDLRPIRMEVVLTRTPGQTDVDWRKLFSFKTGLVIEGRLGQVVTLLGPALAAREIADLPQVAAVRRPRNATRQPLVPSSSRSGNPLAASGLDRLHKLGYRGAGVRVAVIDSDFNGYRDRIGKELPKDTTYIDLTAIRNDALMPDPVAESTDVGRGTRLALAVRFAAPDASLVLIRVDPAAAYQLFTAARCIHSDASRPEGLQDRERELLDDAVRLRLERERLTEERRAVAEDFSRTEEAIRRRQALAERTADLARREQEYFGRLTRFGQLETDLMELRNVRAIVCPLAWDIGYPADGSGPLSCYLDERFFGRPPRHVYGVPDLREGSPLWFQAAGNTRGQVWNGPLTDLDGNGVFEFAPHGVLLPPGRWTREVNFLGWQPTGSDGAADLPAGAKVRLALQWSEAHDPTVSDVLPDPYRVPLADLRLLVLRQRDPSGTRVASDDFTVVARSEGIPQMIQRMPGTATYEHVIEFTVATAGRYAVRLEGAVPPTTRPANFPTLPAQAKVWEAKARLFAEVADTATFGQGRLAFTDFQPGQGGLGTPGDAVAPRTIGAADGRGWPQPYSAFGAAAGRDLLIKPRFLAFDDLPLPGVPAAAGSEQAAAFAAGMLASMMSAGVPISTDLGWLGLPPYGVLHVPPVWLDQLEQRWHRPGKD